MGKITKVNIAAARAQRDILVRRGKPVPEKIQKIADLDPDLIKPAVEPSSTPPNRPEGGDFALLLPRLTPQEGFAHWEEARVEKSVPGKYILASNNLSAAIGGLEGKALFKSAFFIVEHDNLGEADEIIHASGARRAGSAEDLPRGH